MTEAMFALENARQAGDIDHQIGCAGAIHFLGGRIEDQIDTGGFAQGQIGFDRARVFGEILRRAELGGVDEETDRNVRGVFSGGCKKGKMAGVERAHGGDERESPELLAFGTAGGKGVNDDHMGMVIGADG